MPPVYLDAHATTPCDPRVVEAMLPVLTEFFGNPHSRSHAFGWQAEALVEQARERVAALIGVTTEEIIFTSGATEANNLALKGVAEVYAAKGRHIITTAIEHSAILDPCRSLERHGFTVTYLTPPASGVLAPAQVAEALRPETILVSVMAANNEIGTLQPLAEIGALCKAHGVLFHTDAAQSLGYVATDVQACGIDLLSLSAHKFYGPKGVGALYVRRRDPRVRLAAQIEGGGQERGWRSGTLNVPGVVGLGRAAELAVAERAADATRLGALRDHLWAQLQAGLTDITLNGTLAPRLPNNLNVSFAGVDAESLLAGIASEVAVSSGSACASSDFRPSHVLLALGVPEPLARAALRFGLHRFTTETEIDRAAETVIRVVSDLRSASPLYQVLIHPRPTL
jgi:cysteine desulfurase